MQIFIMRHGEAQAYAHSDEQRKLTEFGSKQAKYAGTWLASHHPDIDIAFVSPYLRAQETAKLVCNEYATNIERRTLNFITPESNAKDMHDYLDAIASEKKYQKLIIVSHMPFVSHLVAELTTNNHMAAFSTADIIQINYSVERMTGEVIDR